MRGENSGGPVGRLETGGGTDECLDLYNLRADRSETTNLAASYPDRVKKLEWAWTRRYEEFRAVATKDLPPSPAGATGKPPQTGGGTKEIKKP